MSFADDAGTDRMNQPGMDRARLVLMPHQPIWDAWYQDESVRIAKALDGIAIRIEHIGSTSVPNLLAKPIIDICVVVPESDDFERCVPPLTDLGYAYRGQNGDDPLRRYFVLDRGGLRVAQLHLWAEPATSWRTDLAFRDLLRARPDLRTAYANEKLRVAEEVNWDKRAYSEAKAPFISALMDREFAGAQDNPSPSNQARRPPP